MYGRSGKMARRMRLLPVMFDLAFTAGLPGATTVSKDGTNGSAAQATSVAQPRYTSYTLKSISRSSSDQD